MVTSHRSTSFCANQCLSIVPPGVSLSLSLELYIESFLSLFLSNSPSRYLAGKLRAKLDKIHRSVVLEASATIKGIDSSRRVFHNAWNESWWITTGVLTNGERRSGIRYKSAGGAIYLRSPGLSLSLSPSLHPDARDARRGKIGRQSCWRTYNYFISALSPVLISTMVLAQPLN